MFRLAHAYTALKASGIEDPLVVFGATFPDYSWFAKTGEEKILWWQKIHEDWETLATVNKYLAIGTACHGVSLPGLDFYTHNPHERNGKMSKGFAHDKVPEVLDLSRNVFPGENEKKLLGLTHNLVEIAVDLNIASDLPKVEEKYLLLMKNIDLEIISKQIAKAFGNDPKVFLNVAGEGFETFGPGKKTSIENAIKMAQTGYRAVAGAEINLKALLPAIKKAQKITASDYKEFLDFSSEQIHRPLVEKGLIK